MCYSSMMRPGLLLYKIKRESKLSELRPVEKRRHTKHQMLKMRVRVVLENGLDASGRKKKERERKKKEKKDT